MKLALKISVSFGILGLLFWLLPLEEMREALARFEVGVWVLVLAGLCSAHLLGTVKWRAILAAGRAHLRVAQAVQAYGAGLFANLCMPSIVGGDALRAGLAWRMTRRPEAVALGGLADRLIDVAALLGIATIGGILARDCYDGWWRQLFGVGLILAAVGAVLGLLLFLRPPLKRLPKKVQRIARRGLVALRRIVRSPATACLALTIALTMQTTFVLLNVWIGRSIGIDVPVEVWFLAWPLAKIAGLAPISLAGLGVRDATQAALLEPVGVPYSQGFVASLIWQTELVGRGLLGGAAWTLLKRRDPVGSNVR